MSVPENVKCLPRSYLFVPGNRPELFQKALESGADAVIIDLEDAVAPQDKELARSLVADWIGSSSQVYIRVNAADTCWYEQDIAAFAHHPCVAGLVVPKASNSRDLNAIAALGHADLVLLPMIESAAGFASMQEITSSRSVQRLLFGTIDFQVDLGTQCEDVELNSFRAQITLASVLAGIGSPIDGVTTALDDFAAIEAAGKMAKRFGFGGKLCIHPRQVAPVHEAFKPTDEECEWARRVLVAAQVSKGGVTVLDGAMIDLPVIIKAKAILSVK